MRFKREPRVLREGRFFKPRQTRDNALRNASLAFNRDASLQQKEVRVSTLKSALLQQSESCVSTLKTVPF